jgi:tetratricopeptide (TPR) repeat protein
MNGADDRPDIACRQGNPLTGTRTIVNIRAAVATPDETIGQRIRRLRTEQGLSLRDVAGPGITFAHVSRVEGDRRTASPQALRLLARRLCVSPHYLETGQRARGYALRERRIADAELELRLGRDLERAEAVFGAEADGQSGLEPDEVLTARAHAGIGLLAANRSSLREAIAHLEAAIGTGYLHPAARPDVYEALGTAYTAYGAAAKAVDLFESCLGEIGSPGDGNAALAVRFLTYLALAASSLGDEERVRRVLAEATERAESADIPRPWSGLYWALAIAASNEDRPQAAREYARQAIQLLETADDSVQLARAHIFSAQLLTEHGGYEEADPHLAAAAEGLGSSADPTDLGLLRAEQAKVAAARGDAAALALALEGDRLLADDVRYGGKRWHALAVARAAVGEVEAASACYRNALEVLEERRQWREAAQVGWEWARFLRGAGREAETWEVLDRLTVLAARRPLGAAALA